MYGRSLFRNRADAGKRLAEELKGFAGGQTLVLGLPRGGVPVAYEVARALGAPLDVFVVRKLGLPGREELAIGAIATGDVRVLNEELVRELGISAPLLEAVTAREREELQRRERLFRESRPASEIRGRTVIVVDDGLATGATMLSAVLALRKQEPARIVVAVPVGSFEACSALRAKADRLVCLYKPDPFFAVGIWYRDFSQTSDQEVRELLRRAAPAAPAPIQ
jgi:predicted phosphoribosyltransferase